MEVVRKIYIKSLHKNRVVNEIFWEILISSKKNQK